MKPHAHSVYLLANANSNSRFDSLIKTFNSCGEFLTFEAQPEWLSCYEQDSQNVKSMLPQLVFKPASTTVIETFIQNCCRNSIPVKARCAGTSLCGSSLVSANGILLLTSHLNRLLDYDPESGIVCIEPGVSAGQLNHAVANDGWEFPLDMPTMGVAGLAGCLSSSAKGRHQAGSGLYQSVISATIVDGNGRELQVPGLLLCGAEGMFGIITKMEIQLSRKPQKRLELTAEAALSDLLDLRQLFKHEQCVKSLLWQNNRVYSVIEGDVWRIELLVQKLKRFDFTLGNKNQNELWPDGRSSFIFLSSVVPLAHAVEAQSFLQEMCNKLSIAHQFSIDAIPGVMHILLSSVEGKFEFGKKLEQFAGAWNPFLKSIGGHMNCTYGIGKVWQPYMKLFFSEEELRFLDSLRKQFDPKNLFF